MQTGIPKLSITPALPVPEIPHLTDFGPALWLLALPQVPLSLANSIYSTADAARQYFGDHAAQVTPRRLLSTMGMANLAAALFGGVPVCHGSGGLTAHYRLGARTGGAPLMLGILFLLLGLLGGAGFLPLLKLIPFLGVFLLVFATGLGQIFLFGVLMSLGSAAFASANWALTADLVPKEESARYFGLANIGTAGAAAAAGLFGPLVDWANTIHPGAGYPALFAASTAVLILSAQVLRRVDRALPTVQPESVSMFDKGG